MHRCDFNKVETQLFPDGASVLVFSCGFASCLGASSLENTSGGLLLKGDNFIFLIFNSFFLIKYTCEDFKVSVLLSF